MDLLKNQNFFLPITKIQYATVDNDNPDIDNVTNNVDGSVSVNFLSGKDWQEFYTTKGSLNFSQKQTYVDQGFSYNQELTGNYPGNSFENQNTIQSIIGKPVILKMQVAGCPEPTFLLLGTKNNPVFLVTNFISADFVTKYEIQYNRLSHIPTPYIV